MSEQLKPPPGAIETVLHQFGDDVIMGAAMERQNETIALQTSGRLLSATERALIVQKYGEIDKIEQLHGEFLAWVQGFQAIIAQFAELGIEAPSAEWLQQFAPIPEQPVLLKEEIEKKKNLNPN